MDDAAYKNRQDKYQWMMQHLKTDKLVDDVAYKQTSPTLIDNVLQQ